MSATTTGVNGMATGTTATGTSATGTTATGSTGATTKLQAFEGFLQRAGHLLGVALVDIVKYVVPVAQVVAVADPAASPAIQAFVASLELVVTTVVTAQQRWVQEGSTANPQKLADVLVTVEQPIVLLFQQAGLSVDTGYVTNLINGVVAILNAQPAVQLAAAPVV